MGQGSSSILTAAFHPEGRRFPTRRGRSTHQHLMNRPKPLAPIAAGLLLLLAGRGILHAATIGAGDVTAGLGPGFFVDDASTGGTDPVVTQPAVASYNRNFAGLLAARQGPSRVTLNGFGFATSSSITNNTATSLTITFTYLGADGEVGGDDDVVMGSTTGSYEYSGSGEYRFRFATPITADLDITGTRFRIQVAPSNDSNNGKVLFKSGPLADESTAGPKFSVAGFVAPLRVNLAKFQPVTASSVNGQRLASYVTDGSAGNDNRWQSSGSGPHWARVDFPFPVEVGSAQVFTGVNDTNPQANFRIQHLNAGSWSDVPGAVITGNTDVERNLVFASPVTASSFRVYSTDGTLRIRELALFPPAGSAGYPLGTDLQLNLARQRPALATAHTTGNFALLAVDGKVNRESMWQTSTAGINALEIDLIASTSVGSAHLYSGSPGIDPLADFVLKSWDGSAWQDIPGGIVTGNTAADLAVTFTTPVTTTRVRLEFTNPGTTSVRELCIFPANNANSGYPLGTGISGEPPARAKADDFTDSFYQLTNPAADRFIAVGNNGQPALEEPGLTTEQGEYQILLNLSTGTYRLRNRATGHCLSGAGLSKSPGAPLTDAPYSALPHQDWILDPLDGGTFQLINQWSGLALDIQGGGTAGGTPLVQNPADDSASQRWIASFSSRFPKKGIGGTGAVGSRFGTVFDAGWMYGWGLATSATLPAGAVFHPMQWGNFNWTQETSAASTWKLYPAWRTNAEPLHLMGFNEPDAFSQSGNSLDTENTNEEDFSTTRSMEKAVELWPRLLAMDLPLVSPAPAHNTPGGWLSAFYTNVENLGYRVDYTAYHAYPGPAGGSSNNLVNSLQTAYTNWNRPVWLTEFSFVDWGRNSSWSEEDCYNTLAEFLWRSESLPWLRKYALFVFTEDNNNPQPEFPWSTSTSAGGAPRSNSRDIAGNLTAFGKLYAAWDNDAVVRTEKTYHIHHKSTRKRLANHISQSNVAGRNIRVDGRLVHWTLDAAPTAGRYHIVSSLDGRRLSTDGTTVSLAAAGTTGPNVEWSLTESLHGWHYLGHPPSAKRLRMTYSNNTSTATYSMASGASGDDVQWRFIVPPASPVWSGSVSSSWTDAANWIPGIVPATGDPVTFDSSSIANLATILDQNFSIAGLTVTAPAAPVSIDGTSSLTVGAGGIDLTTATCDLTLTAPLLLGEAQSWNVGSGRTLSVNGGLSGPFALELQGSGTTSLGGPVDPLTPLTVAAGSTLKTTAPGVLASGPTALNLTLSGILDLHGSSQSVNFLTGTGIVDNSAPGPASLTLGHHDAAGTLNALLQNNGGPLMLIKTGSGNLTLPLANNHGGGFTNDGTGNVAPHHNGAFGSGPVVSNAGQIYATATTAFSNPLALNHSTLRIGGGGGKTITWSGPVTATGTSGISADGGTAGITLGSTLNITGATFNSFANGTTHTISGDISGTAGHLNVTGGTLQLLAAATHGGSTTLSGAGTLRLQPAGTISGNVTINGAANFNIRNTVGWVYQGSITGDGSGQINLNTGTNATLAGDISGVATINANSSGTDATISGIISGNANVNVQAQGGILRLLGANSYAGTTTVTGTGILIVHGDQSAATGAIAVNGGTLGGKGTLGGPVTVAASGSLAPGDLSPAHPVGTLSIGGGLDLSAPANGGSGKLRFDLGPLAASDRLTVAGTLAIGSGVLDFSDFAFTALDGLQNGTYPLITSGGISGTLAPAPATLAGPLGDGGSGRLQINGNQLELVVTGLVASNPYATWSGGAAFDDDANGDGVANGLAFLLGASDPDANALDLLPAATRSDGALVLTFDCLAAADRGTATLELQHSDDLGLSHPWFGAPVPGEIETTAAADIQFVVTDPGEPGGLLKVVATIQTPSEKRFARLRAAIP
jgi:hypothetical protein